MKKLKTMDNFYIKIHIGAEKPFFRRQILTDKEIKNLEKNKFKSPKNKVTFQSLYLKLNPDFKDGLKYKDFDADFFKELRSRQLMHSYILCEYLPLATEIKIDKKNLSELRQKLSQIKPPEFSTEDYRLAIGLGNASVFETSIALHHIYGIPYIPASTVKGILRSWIILKYFSNDGEDLECAEINAFERVEFCKIFGAPAEFSDEKCKRKPKIKTAVYKEYKKIGKDIEGYMGDIVFFDAFPIEPPTIEVDIMNPHYPDYYGYEPDDPRFQPPADWQNPVPIFFLTVTNTKFQFLFGLRRGKQMFNVKFDGMQEEKNVIEFLREELKDALETHGVGAKTAVGYGRMREEG